MQENRSDITNALVHLTKERTGVRTQDSEGENKQYSALDVLCEILRDEKILGSTKAGFIKGPNAAVCFSETPLSALKHLAHKDSEKVGARYRFYGIAVSKHVAFKVGARPVIYLPDSEAMWIPTQQKWRHVRYEYGVVDWTHEREWRVKGDFDLKDILGLYVICWHPSEIDLLTKSMGPNMAKQIRGFLPMCHLNQML